MLGWNGIRPTSRSKAATTLVCADVMTSGGTPRNPATSSTPTVSASVVATSAARSGVSVVSAAALWTIARWNRPDDRADASRCSTSPPPADSPNAVTRPGSPPKLAMLSRTHSRAAIASCRPKFALSPPSGRVSRKPKAPTR